MLSNFYAGLRNTRSKSRPFFIRSLNGVEGGLFNSNGILRGFSFDVAPLLGDQISEQPNPAAKPKTRLERKNASAASRIRPTIAPPPDQPSKSTATLPHWVQTPIDVLMFKAEDPGALWMVASKYQLAGAEAVAFFASLAKLAANDGSVSYEKISASDSTKRCFDHVTRSVINECDGLVVGNQTLALRSLLFLGVPGSHELVERLRKALSKNYTRLSHSSLISLAAFHKKYADASELGKDLQRSVEDRLRSDIKQITDPSDLLAALATTNPKESSTWHTQIETRISEALPTFSGEHLVRLLNVLASKKSRPLPLLKAIANQYAHCNDDLPIKKLAALLVDVCTLNYPNLKMLTVVARDIEAKVLTIEKPATICGIFSSLAVMRLRHVDLLAALCDWVREHLNSFSPPELASVLLALARCNYVPENVETVKGSSTDLVKEIAAMISPQSFGDDKSLWLDSVWALAVLQRLKKTHATSVLEKSFYEPLLKDLGGNDYKRLVTQLKLRNVDAAARLEIPGYKGPFLDSTTLKEVTQVNVVQYKEDVVKLMTDSLNNLAPYEKYMQTNVTCSAGYVIDALLRVGADAKPLPVSQWSKPPVNSWPIALMLRHFCDTTQMSDSIIGLHAMATRHLKAMGYLVIEIPASEIEQRRQSLSRVQYLNEKLISAVKSAPPPQQT